MQEVVGEPTYVVGNSLGGYIGTYLAANHPEWVSGLALLNATPFWAFRNPRDLETIPRTPVKTPLSDTSAKEASSLSGGANENPGVVEADACLGNAPESIPTIDRDEDVGGGLSSTQDRSEKRSHGRSGPSDGGGGGLLGWDGILPAPAGFFRFGAWYFDRMRDPRTVRSMLGAVYSSPGVMLFVSFLFFAYMCSCPCMVFALSSSLYLCTGSGVSDLIVDVDTPVRIFR